MLHCGFYEVEITPAIGSGMPGYFSDRRTTTIRDPLYAKAFAAKSQGEPIVLVILDALMVEKEDADHIRQGIAAATGISPANVAVGAIHSHTGGPVISLYNSNRDPEYCKFMIRRAINAGIMAFQRMEPARLAVDSRNVEGIAFCRRFLMADGSYKTNPVMLSPDIISPADVVDPQLVTVRVDRTDGTPMGIIANFALHTDTVNKGVYGFSADYPGQIREKVHEKYGNHVHFLFLQGTSGNVNHIDVTKSSEQQIGYRELAQILFAEISDMVDHMKTEDVETVSCVSCVREGYTRRPTHRTIYHRYLGFRLTWPFLAERSHRYPFHRS